MGCNHKILLPIQTDEAYKYVKEAVTAYPEIYFARIVVLAEGDSEEIIIPRVLELSGSNIDAGGISVAPLGGRYVNHFWKLLKQLDIPFITLLDLDLERYGGGWGRVKYVLKQLIEFGYDKEQLLKTEGGVLTDKELEGMNTWDSGSEDLPSWISFLERYNVFFSAPLDLDFMMLQAFSEEYKSILSGSEGPYIKGLGKIAELSAAEREKDEYKHRIEDDIKATLKSQGGNGATYTNQQQELMIWYNYFFLNRGKPSTHILALSMIDDNLMMEKLPDPLQRLKGSVEKFLANDPFSELAGGEADE